MTQPTREELLELIRRKDEALAKIYDLVDPIDKDVGALASRAIALTPEAVRGEGALSEEELQEKAREFVDREYPYLGRDERMRELHAEDFIAGYKFRSAPPREEGGELVAALKEALLRCARDRCGPDSRCEVCCQIDSALDAYNLARGGG